MQDYDLMFRYILNIDDIFEIRKYDYKKEFDLYRNDNFYKVFDDNDLSKCKKNLFELIFFILKAKKKNIDEDIERIVLFLSEGYQ